eukprot:SAG31_NODE_606_length_13607_cov_17.509846_5_plen_211_part_00
MRHWTYSKALNVSMVLLTLAHVLDIVMYQRLNRVLGIPDWLFMLGKTSTTSTVYMMNFLPTTLLISKICPDGLETTTYAMLAGISNFGQSVCFCNIPVVHACCLIFARLSAGRRLRRGVSARAVRAWINRRSMRRRMLCWSSMRLYNRLRRLQRILAPEPHWHTARLLHNCVERGIGPSHSNVRSDCSRPSHKGVGCSPTTTGHYINVIE